MRTLKTLPIVFFLVTAFGVAQENLVGQNPEEMNTALWRGVYHYPEGSGQESVKFNLVMIQNGTTVAGYIREPNTFGSRGEPWLHALIKGNMDKATGNLTFTKTYDGTAGQNHDVQYIGKTSPDGTRFEGTWTIANALVGQFTLVKVPNTGSGLLAGVWTGAYHYAAESGREPVRFNVIMVHNRQGVSGSIKETNTFGNQSEPWLVAGIKGHFDQKTNKVTFTKTYDGTAGEEHDVEYTGTLSQDRNKMEGAWALDDDTNDRFTIQRLPLDEKMLEVLR